MPAPILYLSDDQTALQQFVLNQCQQVLTTERLAGQAGTVLWITPSLRAQKQWTQRLTQSFGRTLLAPPLCTFEGFAERLLHAAGRPATAISSTVRRLVLRRIVKELYQAGGLDYFSGVVETSGFLDVVESLIRELKRDEIWPEDFAAVCQSSTTYGQRNRELCEVYRRYQDVLLARNWYDPEGRFWLARTELEEGRCRGLPHWRWIALAGFNDFTQTQQEILALLASRTEQLVVTLPQPIDERRADVFARSTITRHRLRSLWPAMQEQWISTMPGEHPDRSRLRQSLFGNPRQIERADQCSLVEVVAGAGSHSELTSVALRLKNWLAAGVRPSDIVVGLRSLPEHGLSWTRKLTTAGLPVWCELGPLLQESGLIKFLSAVLAAELENWSYPRLAGVWGSSFLQLDHQPGLPREGGRHVLRVLRSLRLSEGRHEILTSVQRAADRWFSSQFSEHDAEGLDDPESVLYRDVPAAVFLEARAFVTWYAQATEVLLKTRTLNQWIDTLAGLMDDLGATISLQGHDLAVWDRWQGLLRDAAEAEQQFTTARKLSLEELVVEIRDLLSGERSDPPQEPAGSIRFLSFDQLRHLDVPYVVLASLIEESFPNRRSDDCLFSDSERRAFVEQGLPLRHATQHQQDELQFFYQLVQTASQKLLLTYSDLNHRGHPVYSSPYLTALRTLWMDTGLPIQQEGQLDPIPLESRTIHPEEARLLAMHAALEGHSGWLRGLAEESSQREMVTNLLGAVEMNRQRFHATGFTEYEGRLELGANQQWLAERFYPDRQFSATEFESFATCPFRFWLQSIMKVLPVPDVESGTDVMRRGVVIHEVLSQLVVNQEPFKAQEGLSERFHLLAKQVLEGEFANSDLQKALVRIEKEILADWAVAYETQLAHYCEQVSTTWQGAWMQTLPEIPFGSVQGVNSTTAHRAVAIGTGSARVLLRGRIDRLDVGRSGDQTLFTVIDYKTGQSGVISGEDVRQGRTLQLVLYAIAARRLGLVPADAVPFQIGYWRLGDEGFRSGIKGQGKKFVALEATEWDELEQIVDETIPRLVEGMRRGEFVVDNPKVDCVSRCVYHTICRVQQTRAVAVSLAKIRPTETARISQ